MDKNLDQPLISIVMPAYNASRYINAAILSILNQTYRNFELIIINDGSTDDTLEKINLFKDKRIIIINQTNKGLVDTLNRGINLAKAEFIARQDADDISEPTRLEEQIYFFKKSPDTILIGSSMGVIDMDSKKLHNHYVLLSDAEIKLELLIRSPFAHGSVMFRKVAFEQAGGYKKDEWPAEDYGLWLRMAPYGNFANINKPLYLYRENNEGISAKNIDRQQVKVIDIQKTAWQSINLLFLKSINTKKYNNLVMGQERQERIVKNIIFIQKNAVKKSDLRVVAKCAVLIIRDKNLIRKYVRLLLVKIGIKK